MAGLQLSPDKRPLKRPRLGPPDFYPQENRQGEDDLTPDKLRQGYSYKPPFNTSEYESGKLTKLEEKLEDYSAKVVQSYNAIIVKKNEINTLQDAAKKKAAVRNEQFWHCAARPKMQDAWFRDLAGSKPLTVLSKRFPFFNKRDDIFYTLIEFGVPMCRAIWFVKMTNAYLTQQQESGKMKKKQLMDPCLDWTHSLMSFLRLLFSKFVDYHVILCSQTSTADSTAALKQWQYCVKLARHMFDEGLLDKQEFLTSVLDLFSEKCIKDESPLKLFLPVVMQYLDGILLSELLSRKLAYLCCKRLAAYYADVECYNGPPSPTNGLNQSWHAIFVNCQFHKSIVYSLSAIVQSVLIECPTSLVWHSAKTNLGSLESYLYGSPLDILPCFPSELPMPDGGAYEQILDYLKIFEQDVRTRSGAVDNCWSFDNREQSGFSTTVSYLLGVIEALDRFYYDKSSEKNNIDCLYSSIFSIDAKDLEKCGEIIVVKFLCHWAVSNQGTGYHRAIVVARLLEKRKNDLIHQDTENGPVVKNCSTYFQNVLLDYLDNEAPTQDENCQSLANHSPSATGFTSLVLLFNEMIRHGIFSHDVYLKILISRGDLANNCFQIYSQQQQQLRQQAHQQNLAQKSTKAFSSASLGGQVFANPLSLGEVRKKGESGTGEIDFGEAKGCEDVKLDIDKILATIDRPNSSDLQSGCSSGRFEKMPMSVGSSYPGSADPPHSLGPSDPPSSNQSVCAPHSVPCVLGSSGQHAKHAAGSVNQRQHQQGGPCGSIGGPQMTKLMHKGNKSAPITTISRHFYYVLSFVVPQDDEYKHECNQRQLLLYGCGPLRDFQKSAMKKFIKEINKLWHKKNSVECSSSGVLKLKRKLNFDALKPLALKYRALAHYDQYVVTDCCADACLEQIQDFIACQSNYLPNVENIDFLLGLYESSCNLCGLLEYIEAMLALLPKLEKSLISGRNCSTSVASNFVLTICLCCIGFLSKYLTYAFYSTEQLVNIWKLLLAVVRHRDPLPSNASAERCIFSLLDEICNCCLEVRQECADFLTPFKSKIEMAHSPEAPIPPTGRLDWDRKFACELFEDPKKEIETATLKMLENNPELRYSFVANAVLSLINSSRNNDRIFEICRLCADVTALCPGMAAEWVSILKVVTASYKITGPKQPFEYGAPEFIKLIDLCDPAVHYPLGVLVSTLLARNCLKTETFVIFVAMHVFMPLYKKIVPNSPSNNQLVDSSFKMEKDVEGAVRLVLYWCTVIFLRTETTGHSYVEQLTQFSRLRGETYLTCGALRLVEASTILTLFITLFMFGEKANDFMTDFVDDSSSHLHNLLDGCSDNTTKSKRRNLSTYVNDLLYNICQQNWAKGKFVQPSSFLDDGLFLNPMQSHSQAQKMMRMVCRSSAESNFIRDLDQCQTKRELINKILQNLSIWNLNASFLDLELMLKQTASLGQSNVHLQEFDDLIAKAAIDVFRTSSDSSQFAGSPKKNLQSLNEFKLIDVKSEWLVAPLISKLPPSIQGRVLKSAASVLENGQLKKEKNLFQGASLLGQQPFLSLVLICLRGQDDQRETLLGSLLKQLQEYCLQAKADRYQFATRANCGELRENLKLRLSLVGGMFDTVCNSSSIDNWALTFLQLLLYGVITYDFDTQLFNTCVDMLCILIHSCLAAVNSHGAVDDCRKLLNNTTKKLKREIGDRFFPALKPIYQLLPIPRQYQEVIACDQYGSQPSKTARIGTPTSSSQISDSTSRRGLQIVGKERISPWDLIEGYRGDWSAGGTSKWSLFQAVKLDVQPESAVAQLNKLVLHDHYHQFKRPSLPGDSRAPDHFLEPLPVHYDPVKLQQLEKGSAPPGFKDDGGRVATSSNTVSAGSTQPSVDVHPSMDVGGGSFAAGGDFNIAASQQILSPRGKSSTRGSKKSGTSTSSARGGRKQNRGGSAASTSAPQAPPYATMGMRQMGLAGVMAPSSVGPTPVTVYHSQLQHHQAQAQHHQAQTQHQHQQQALAISQQQQMQAMPYGSSQAPVGWTGQGGGGVARGPQMAMVQQQQQASQPQQQFQQRPSYHQGNAVPQQLSTHSNRSLISARLRNRHQSGSGPNALAPSGTVGADVQGYNLGAQPPSVQAQAQILQQQQQQQQQRHQQQFAQQHVEQQKMVQEVQYVNPMGVQQQMQAQIEQHRQQLMSENAAAVHDPNMRPQMHRHMTGPLEHPEMIRQQNFGPSNLYVQSQSAAPGPARLTPSRASPGYGGAGPVNFVGGGAQPSATNQNQVFQTPQQQQQFYSMSEQSKVMSQQQSMQQQQQQNEMMMGAGPGRYASSMMPDQGNYAMMAGNQMNISRTGGPPQQTQAAFFMQQQQQPQQRQSPAVVLPQQQSQQQGFQSMSQQQFQQQQQAQQIYQQNVQRMPAAYNMQSMGDQNPAYYQQY